MRKLSEIFTMGLAIFVKGSRIHGGMCSALEDLYFAGMITYDEYTRGSYRMERWLDRHCVDKPISTVSVKTHLSLYYPSQPKRPYEVWKLFREFYFFLIWDLARRGE